MSRKLRGETQRNSKRPPYQTKIDDHEKTVLQKRFAILVEQANKPAKELKNSHTGEKVSNAWAQLELAKCYESGKFLGKLDVAIDLDKAADLRTKAEAQKLEDAKHTKMNRKTMGQELKAGISKLEDQKLGQLLEEKKRLEQELEIINASPRSIPKTIEEPSQEELYEMGLFLEKIRPATPKDLAKAAEFFKEAAIAGHSEAQIKAGKYHETGKGLVEKDLAMATMFYSMASVESPEGRLMLALCNINNANPVKDIPQGVELLEKLANENKDDLVKARAQYHFGECLQNGIGIAQDRGKAEEFFKKAVTNFRAFILKDIATSNHYLAICHEKGQGVKVDLRMASVHYAVAGIYGNEDSQIKSGEILASEGNNKAAAEWYKRAADQGNVEAQAKLEALEGDKKSSAKPGEAPGKAQAATVQNTVGKSLAGS